MKYLELCDLLRDLDLFSLRPRLELLLRLCDRSLSRSRPLSRLLEVPTRSRSLSRSLSFIRSRSRSSRSLSRSRSLPLISCRFCCLRPSTVF
jgi:hypothetical protein